MRYAELLLRPRRGGFHPAEDALIEAPDVERVAIHHMNQLDDGTIVFLYELQGNVERVRRIYDAHDDIISYSISTSEDNDIHSYIHFRPNDLVDTLFRLPQEHSLVVEIGRASCRERVCLYV